MLQLGCFERAQRPARKNQRPALFYDALSLKDHEFPNMRLKSAVTFWLQPLFDKHLTSTWSSMCKSNTG